MTLLVDFRSELLDRTRTPISSGVLALSSKSHLFVNLDKTRLRDLVSQCNNICVGLKFDIEGRAKFAMPISQIR